LLRSVAAAAAALFPASCAFLGQFPPFHEVETGLPGNVTAERACFGIVEEQRWPQGDLLSAIRPLVVEAQSPGRPLRRNYLPPLAVHSESDVRHRTRVWPIFGMDSLGTAGERERGESDDDTMLLPLVGWGSEPGQPSWWMVFPLGGHLEQKIFSDQIDFVLFPIWARTRTGDWHSTHVLWPLICWGEGEGRSHARFIPFWSQTDGPKSSQRTLLWPIVHWGTETRGDRTFDGWFVFPAVGHRTSRDGSYSEWTALWPFFYWSDDEKNGDRTRGILWPFHKETERPEAGISSTWWWPFWGDYNSPTETSAFYAWPIVWKGQYEEGEGATARTSRRLFVVPLWMERESGPAGGAPDSKDLRSWPLFSFERTRSGEETLRVPDLIPFFGWQAGETAWSDLFALFKMRSDDQGRKAWDLPFGIVRYRRDAAGASKLTFLWWIDLPLGGGTPAGGPR
jgi:hypothetical protein